MGGDTDVGIGVGQLSNIARASPGVKPHVWRIESAGFISFKTRSGPGSASGIVIPYQNIILTMTDPHFLTERLRLEFRPSFTRETTQRFLGLATLQWRHRAPNLNATSTAADTQRYRCGCAGLLRRGFIQKRDIRRNKAF